MKYQYLFPLLTILAVSVGYCIAPTNLGSYIIDLAVFVVLSSTIGLVFDWVGED